MGDKGSEGGRHRSKDGNIRGDMGYGRMLLERRRISLPAFSVGNKFPFRSGVDSPFVSLLRPSKSLFVLRSKEEKEDDAYQTGKGGGRLREIPFSSFHFFPFRAPLIFFPLGV